VIVAYTSVAVPPIQSASSWAIRSLDSRFLGVDEVLSEFVEHYHLRAKPPNLDNRRTPRQRSAPTAAPHRRDRTRCPLRVRAPSRHDGPPTTMPLQVLRMPVHVRGVAAVRIPAARVAMAAPPDSGHCFSRSLSRSRTAAQTPPKGKPPCACASFRRPGVGLLPLAVYHRPLAKTPLVCPGRSWPLAIG
jgi:hypothetical protein